MQLRTFIIYFNYIHFSYAKIWQIQKHKTPVPPLKVNRFRVKWGGSSMVIYYPIKLWFITLHIQCSLRHQQMRVRKPLTTHNCYVSATITVSLLQCLWSTNTIVTLPSWITWQEITYIFIMVVFNKSRKTGGDYIIKFH